MAHLEWKALRGIEDKRFGVPLLAKCLELKFSSLSRINDRNLEEQRIFKFPNRMLKM